MAFTFIRWLRTGLAASVGDQPGATGSARRAKVTVGVDVAGTGLQSQVATVDLDVLGPGDVSGIDPRQIIRTFPVPGTLDFEPSYHAHIELDRPDLPWLFTPFGPTLTGTLRPWICLVIVERGENAILSPGVPLPLLTVTGPEVAKLPLLSQSHVWAHVQIAGSAVAGAHAIIDNDPGRILARLICARVLDADRAYLACLVPTFQIGALAGLGRPVPTTLPLDAWSATDSKVELPVYYHWEFSTGREGDFRSLVLRLEARPVPQAVGTRPLDVTTPGFGLPDRTTAPAVPIGGALRATQPVAPPADLALAAQLQPLLNATGAVAPPIYGRWHAAVTQVAATAGARQGWVEGLNLDPRHRAAASLGTRVVQDRQEDLMSAIWEQFAEILRANQLLRQAQLAVAASERVVARHLAPLSNTALLSVAGPAIARIRTAPATTLRKTVGASCLPVLALSGAFRRIVRVRGPIDRRLGRLGRTSFPDVLLPPTVSAPALINDLARGSLAPPAPRLPSGAVPVPGGSGFRWRGGRPPARPPFNPPTDEPGPLEELAQTLAVLARRATERPCAPLDVPQIVATVRGALVPDDAVAGRARAQVRLPRSTRVKVSHRLDPVMAAPEIPTPMIGPLQEFGHDWLLPGIGELPPNTVAIVEPNAAFIEAYMVGLNHEMARELLWRGFPTDQRGTVFSRFWDRRGSVSTTTVPTPSRDIPDIHQWDTQLELGDNLDSGAGTGLVVLLVRGDLLQRYPRVTIFAQRGRWLRDTGGAIVMKDGLAQRAPGPLPDAAAWEADVRFPQFNGRVGADMIFLGFPVSKKTIHGIEPLGAPATATDDQAGWYVVFEEQPTEPRFGPISPPPPAPADQADALAAQLLRRAFRLSVHARDLVQA